MRRPLLLAAVLAACAPSTASAAALIAAYDRYEPGQGFQIGLVNVATGAALTVPTGVNTSADELHPTLSADGRFLWFARTQLQPTLSGDVPIPEQRTLLRLNRATGAVTELTQDGSAGFGVTFTDFGRAALAFGTRERPFTTSQRIVGIARPVSESTGAFGAEQESRAVSTTPFDTSPEGTPETTELAQEIKADGSFGRTFLSRASLSAAGGLRGSGIQVFTDTPARKVVISGANHAAPRPGDGYVAFQKGVGGSAEIATLSFPDTTATNAPSPINTDDNFSALPTWSPDLGKHLGFVTGGFGTRLLKAYDTTPGIQDFPFANINLGTVAPTAQLRFFHDVFGGLSLALDNSVPIPTITCAAACVKSRTTTTLLRPGLSVSPAGQAIGIFVARVTGRRELLGRKVPEINTVGRVPLGATKQGRNRFAWDGKVAGKRLARGTYLLTYRALQDDAVVATSDSVRFKVDRRGRPRGFQKL